MLEKRKSYYTGGLISLIFLPIVCLLYVQKSNSFKKYYAFDVIRFNDEWFRNYPEYKFKFPPDRHFQIVEISGNEIKANMQLDHTKTLIRKMILQKDSLNGIIIRFTDNTKYWSFVKALDICKTENITTYALYYDDLYIYEQPSVRIPSKNKIQSFNCAVIYPPNIKENSFIQILKSNNKFIILIIAFILLSFLSLNRIYDKGKRLHKFKIKQNLRILPFPR